jgi:hypothetical protein
MNGFAWLNELMTWLARWVPRLTLVKATHKAVIFGPGGSVALRDAGLCCYWPITHVLQLIGMRTRSLELAGQLHRGEVVSVVITWCVTDAVKAATSLADVEAFLDDRTQAALSNAHGSGAPAPISVPPCSSRSGPNSPPTASTSRRWTSLSAAGCCR